MHCKSCDVLLSKYELTLKSKVTGQYEDMCVICLSHVPEVKTYSDREEDDFEEDDDLFDDPYDDRD